MASTPAGDHAWRTDLALIAVPALAVFAFCLVAYQRYSLDGDTNLHVAAGRWILAHGHVLGDRPLLRHLCRTSRADARTSGCRKS